MNSISFKERFFGIKTPSGISAPSTIGAPVFTNSVDYSVFAKTVEEKEKICMAKKAQNKKWKKLFGTKRPSAGVVRRYFEKP